MSEKITTKIENFNITINLENLDSNKLIWKCLLAHIDGGIKMNLSLLKEKIKEFIIDILWNDIYCEFNNITDDHVFNIEITGVQHYSNNEKLLETLVNDNDTYTMCTCSLNKNLEIYNNKKFENWYKKNKIVNINKI